MMMPKRGEIWLVRFPFSDLTSAKLRPALVWAIHSQDVIILGLFSRIPASTKRKTWIVFEEKHPAFHLAGLKKTSLIRTEKIAVVHKSVFRSKLGKLSEGLMDDVEKALKRALKIK